MRKERAERRNFQGKSKLDLCDAQQSGRKVITVNEISYAWGEQTLINNFSTTIWRGDKIGIIGLNGSGKTTLLNLLLKKLEPNNGSIMHGTKLEVAYFDQHRDQLDDKLSVAENATSCRRDGERQRQAPPHPQLSTRLPLHTAHVPLPNQ